VPQGMGRGAAGHDLESGFNPSAVSQTSLALINNPPVRPQLAEEDECPVCSQELPPMDPDGSNKTREAHIENCIKSHMYSSTPPVPREDPLASQSLTGAPETTQPALGQPSGSRPRRMTGGRMLVYKATEKDCTGEDGLAQECIVCLEEFEVADDMGRLECLCKFHRVSVLGTPVNSSY
jgi:hypothetical protein